MSYICRHMSNMKKYTSSEAHSELHEAAALYIRVPGPGKKESSRSGFDFAVFADKINIIEAIKAGISYNLYESLSVYVPLARLIGCRYWAYLPKHCTAIFEAAGDHVFSPIHSEKLLRWPRSLIWVMRSLVLKINSGFGSMPRVLLSGLQAQRALISFMARKWCWVSSPAFTTASLFRWRFSIEQGSFCRPLSGVGAALKGARWNSPVWKWFTLQPTDRWQWQSVGPLVARHAS